MTAFVVICRNFKFLEIDNQAFCYQPQKLMIKKQKAILR